ncbi:MAG: hypothetical protein U0800_20155 [Isosphaeraceae bacterium]
MLFKTLKKFGNSVGLTIDRPLLDAMNLSEGMTMSVQIEGDAIVIRRADDARFREAAARTLKNHRNTLRKLAE